MSWRDCHGEGEKLKRKPSHFSNVQPEKTMADHIRQRGWELISARKNQDPFDNMDTLVKQLNQKFKVINSY